MRKVFWRRNSASVLGFSIRCVKQEWDSPLLESQLRTAPYIRSCCEAVMRDVPEHVRRNRVLWDAWAQKFAAGGADAWAQDTPTWGIWSVPESQLGMFPAGLAGKDVIELGCGTAYVSSWLARRGARVVGIDNSATQLATARRLQRQYGLDFPLLHGNAEGELLLNVIDWQRGY